MAVPRGKVRLRFADGRGYCIVPDSKSEAIKEAKSVGAVAIEDAVTDEVLWTVSKVKDGGE